MSYFTMFSSSLKKSKIYGGPRGGLFEAPGRSRRAQKCRILRGFRAPLKNLEFLGVLGGCYLRHRVGLGGSKSVVFYEVFGRLISISTQINANRAARFVNKVCMYVLLYVQICKIFQVSTLIRT